MIPVSPVFGAEAQLPGITDKAAGPRHYELRASRRFCAG